MDGQPLGRSPQVMLSELGLKLLKARYIDDWLHSYVIFNDKVTYNFQKSEQICIFAGYNLLSGPMLPEPGTIEPSNKEKVWKKSEIVLS